MKKYGIDLHCEDCFGLGHYACTSSSSGEGRIYIPYGSEGGENGNGYALYSSDNGMTFTKTEAKPYPSQGFKKLSDGTFIAFDSTSPTFQTLYNSDYGEFDFCLTVYRAETYDDILEGRVTTRHCILDIPGLICGYGDSANRGVAGYVTGWIELSNGDILLMMYGHTDRDNVICPYFREWGKYDFTLYCTWCMVSHDRGKSFEFVCTVADCQRYPIADINAEGYCEPDIAELEDGHILAILRTAGHNVKSPLYACHSYDYGRTWEKPYEISEWGALPRILKMRSGRIVVATGHPDVFILVSDDGGITWSDKIMVQDDPGDWGMTSSGYNSIFEASDGTITLVYDASFEAKNDLPEDAPLHRYVYRKTFRLTED